MKLYELICDCNAVQANTIRVQYYDDPSGEEVVLSEQTDQIFPLEELYNYLDQDILCITAENNIMIIEIEEPKFIGEEN